MKIRLNRSDFDRIAKQARETLPNECCGLLAGHVDGDLKIVQRIYLLTNVDGSSQHFSMDPKEQLEAVLSMRTLGLKPLGNYHSHPETPARPSEEDIRLARDPKASYLIMSLASGEPSLKAFHIEKGAASLEEIEVLE
ncbi:MAG: M67 family metallopeptidase [Clostridiales bacterium]|jgi:proteasome lid subunit RPN8/RPN11|nr:M67 family metallopeptidase [Clostridiales bacterium]